MKIGTDMDGVLCWNSLDKALFRPYKLHQYHAQCSATGYAERFWMYIITGRKEHFRRVTERWLIANGVRYGKLVMFPNKQKKTNRSLAQFKSSVINELGVTKYYEDDTRIAEFLKNHCPNTEIIYVKNTN